MELNTINWVRCIMYGALSYEIIIKINVALSISYLRILHASFAHFPTFKM